MKNNFEKHINRRGKIAVIGISTRCNLDCVFCSDKNAKNTPEPSFNEIKEKIDNFKREGVEEIIYMTCESLLRSDFFKILNYVSEMGFRQILITNGTLIADRKFFKKIARSPLRNIQISMSCFDAVSSKKITGSEIAWEKQLEAIKNIKRYNDLNKKNKIKFTLRIVINKININNVVKIIENCKKIYKPEFKIAFKLVHLNHLKKIIPEILPEPEQVKKNFIEIARYLRSNNFKKKDISFDNFPLCMIPGLEECSRETRDLNRKTEYFFDTYKKSHKKEKKPFSSYVKTKKCRQCDYDSICVGIWSDYLEYFGAKVLACLNDKNCQGVHIEMIRKSGFGIIKVKK